MLAFRVFVLCTSMVLLTSCGLPPLLLLEDPSVEVAPSGPPVAALLANLKCELWEAAKDNTELPYFLDAVGNPLHAPPRHPSPDRAFTLRNLFSEIEYIAELKLTLEVTDSGALNPSANFIQPLVPSTNNLTLAVGGQIYDSADRVFDLYQSVDFMRLIESLPKNTGYTTGLAASFFKGQKEPPLAEPPYNNDGELPCDHGLGLHGRLGLKEALATSAIAARMQDVAVLLSSSGSQATVYGQAPSISGFNGYAFGEMDTTIDFTINLDANAGPNWSLATLKGPNVASEGGANGSGLANISRWAKDSLVLTVIPVCIRQKYFPEAWLSLKQSQLKAGTNNSPSFDGELSGNLKDGALSGSVHVGQSPAKKTQLPPLQMPITYVPEMGVGTPIWANYLPPCFSPQGQAALASAPATAKTNLQLEGINNLLRNQRRY